MAKKIQIEVDVKSETVKFATDQTLTLTQQTRLLRKELEKVPEGTKEWTLIQNKLNETEDNLNRVKIKSKELFGTMSALPGVIGQVGGEIDSTIGTLKTFSKMSVGDIKNQFKAFGADLKDIGGNLLTLTGITKLYDFTVKGLTKGMIALGIAEDTAAASARGLSVALITTGIGALVVAVGYLIANFDELKDSMSGVTEESKAYAESQKQAAKQVAEFNTKLYSVQAALEAAEKGTLSKKDALKEYNDKLGETVGYANSLEQAEALMAANTANVVKSIGLKAQAQELYAIAARKASEATTAEEVGFFSFSRGLFQFYDKELAERKAKLKSQSTDIKAEGDKLLSQAFELDKLKVKGEAKPPEEKKEEKKKVETPAEKAAKQKKLDQDRINSNEALKQSEDELAQAKIQKSKDVVTQLGNEDAAKETNYQRERQRIVDLLALEKVGTDEYKNIQAQLNTLDAQRLVQKKEYALNLEAEKAKQKVIEDKEKEDKFKADQEAFKYAYEQNQKLIDLEKLRADAIVQQNNIITQSWIDLGNNISGILGTLAQTFASNEDLQKIFAVAQVAVNTAASIGSIILSGKSQQAEYDKAIAAGNASIALAATTAFIPGAQVLAAAQFKAGAAAVTAGVAGKANAKRNTIAQSVAAGVAGAAQIAAILSAKKSSGGTSGGGATSTGGGSAPTPAFNGTVAIPAPVIGASSASPSGNLGQTIMGAVQAGNSTSRPIQTYVVGDQVSTQQQLDRRISSAAKMGG